MSQSASNVDVSLLLRWQMVACPQRRYLPYQGLSAESLLPSVVRYRPQQGTVGVQIVSFELGPFLKRSPEA